MNQLLIIMQDNDIIFNTPDITKEQITKINKKKNEAIRLHYIRQDFIKLQSYIDNVMKWGKWYCYGKFRYYIQNLFLNNWGSYFVELFNKEINDCYYEEMNSQTTSEKNLNKLIHRYVYFHMDNVKEEVEKYGAKKAINIFAKKHGVYSLMIAHYVKSNLFYHKLLYEVMLHEMYMY